MALEQAIACGTVVVEFPLGKIFSRYIQRVC